jgi:ribonuclease R
MEKTADHISVTERNSADAERDSRDVKLFAFLGAQLNEESPQAYDAMVTDIRNFGFFVDVTDLGMSGLVHLSSFENDFFVFDSVRNHLVGRATKRVIRLGDVLKVQVCKVDTFKKQVDFRAVQEAGSSAGGRSGRPQRGRADSGSRGTRGSRGDRGDRGDRGSRSGRGGQRPGGSRPRRGGRPERQEQGQRPAEPRKSQGAGKPEGGAKSEQRGQSRNRGRKASSQRSERGEQRSQQGGGQQQSKRTDHRKGRRSSSRPRSSKPRRQG